MFRRAEIKTSQFLSAFNEYFPEAQTKVAHKGDERFIEAMIPEVNLDLHDDEWIERPVHFYSDLPLRLEDMWKSMQKRKLETFIDYLKSIGTADNPTIVLTKLSARGNRYFTVTSKRKYLNYRDAHYSGYSVESI